MSVGELILWYRLNTNWAARRWTFSMLFVYFFIGYGSLALESSTPNNGDGDDNDNDDNVNNDDDNDEDNNDDASNNDDVSNDN